MPDLTPDPQIPFPIPDLDFLDFNAVVTAYLDCAQKSEGSSQQSRYVFTSKARYTAAKDVYQFLSDAAPVIIRDTKGCSEKALGHDLWLTRNGYWAGFLDGSYSDTTCHALFELAADMGDVPVDIDRHLGTIDFV